MVVIVRFPVVQNDTVFPSCTGSKCLNGQWVLSQYYAHIPTLHTIYGYSCQEAILEYLVLHFLPFPPKLMINRHTYIVTAPPTTYVIYLC